MSASMCLRKVSEAQASKFRRSPQLVAKATLGLELTSSSFPFRAAGVLGLEPHRRGFGASRGIAGWVAQMLVRRAVNAAIRKQVEQLRGAHAAMRGAMPLPPSNFPSADPAADLQESWHVLHYLLTGTPDSGPAPLNMLLVGGEEVGVDLGHGPTRLIDSRSLHDFSRALAEFDLERGLRRLNLATLAAAGVSCACEGEGTEVRRARLLDELRQNFRVLQGFTQSAAADRQAALIWFK